MADLAMHVEALGKQFRVGRQQGGYPTLREMIAEGLGKPLAWIARASERRLRVVREPEDTVWALKNVSFDVRHGEVIGIIGCNGAGKSTLLKILSRITEPTEGYADVAGRVASLLEVGTGFHPELTGRENVYLNGAILGMRQTEIQAKFNEIVAFAGVERFIDTPVKHYSSGMTVRLAFAVAAHLEPEILIIDEVLAVGDATFQKRCLGKMEGVAKDGRTVLFVSHNMIAVQSLCHRAIWLHEGTIVEDGKPVDVVARYLRNALSTQTEQRWADPQRAPGNSAVRLHRIGVQGPDVSQPELIAMDKPFQIEVEFWNLHAGGRLSITLHLYTEQQVLAFSTGSGYEAMGEEGALAAGLFRSICRVPGNLLNSGLHRAVLLVVENRSRVIYRHEDALTFEVMELSGRQFGWQGKEPGAVRPHLHWTTVCLDNDDVPIGSARLS